VVLSDMSARQVAKVWRRSQTFVDVTGFYPVIKKERNAYPSTLVREMGYVEIECRPEILLSFPVRKIRSRSRSDSAKKEYMLLLPSFMSLLCHESLLGKKIQKIESAS